MSGIDSAEVANPGKKRVLIVHNPNSGAADRTRLLDALQETLKSAGFEVQVQTSLDQLAESCRDPNYVAQLRTVISAGGDGTASAVASRVPAELPITLFPLGTENLLARWLGAVAVPEAALASIKELSCRKIDAATANGILSLIMVGVGYDAQVVHEVHSRRTGHITKWAYGWPMFWHAFQYTFPPLPIRAYHWKNLEMASEQQTLPRLPNPERGPSNGFTEDPLCWSARWLFVANLPNYAGGLSVVPNARSDDGYLCAATFQRGFAIPGLAYAASIYFRQQHWLPDYRVVRAQKFVVESPVPVRFQVDGDDGGNLPLEIQVLPGRVCLVEPAKST